MVCGQERASISSGVRVVAGGWYRERDVAMVTGTGSRSDTPSKKHTDTQTESSASQIVGK